MIQVRLKVTVRHIRNDNGTEFVNQTLREYYEQVGISNETSVACSPQQNGVVERRSCTLIEAAHTMLIHAQALLFLWAEAVATTYNGTEFVNQTLRDYYEEVGISHETSVARSPQRNGVIERRNRTLIEAARTMLIYAQAPLFLWAEAVEIACFTQNRSIIRLRYGKTLYELMYGKQPDLSFFHVFGALCYPTNDSENIGKLQQKDDIGIFIGYAPTKKAFCIYNRRTRRIVETIHVDFDELTEMASEQSSSGPAL
nr:retrovirus-related Pol polyprotein from transposon TNT 1-94 [Tanacetum cinerariifolium]